MKKANLLSLLLVSAMLVACGGGSSSTDEGGTGTGGDTGTGGGDTGTGGGDSGTGGGDTDTGGGDTDTGGGDTGTGGGDTGTGGGDSGTGGGDTGTGGGDTGTGGGDTGTGGGDTLKDVNPFANDNIPKQKESLRLIQARGEVFTYTFDPVEGKFSYKNDDGSYLMEGDYDPVAMTVTVRSCEWDFSPDCSAVGEVYELESLLSGFKGDGLVLFSENEGQLELYGYNPTDEANLPSEQVTYNGKFAANLFGDDFRNVVGDATTTVDFGADKLSTEFSNFSGDGIVSAGIENVTLNGSTFSGGEFTYTTTDGTVEGGDTQVYGEFFGEEGQELGGSMVYKLFESPDDESPSISINGVWTGKK